MCVCRRGSRILVAPVEFWPQGGALSPRFAQDRGFSLKTAWKLHDLEKNLGGKGGDRPRGPLDPLVVCVSVCCSSWRNKAKRQVYALKAWFWGHTRIHGPFNGCCHGFYQTGSEVEFLTGKEDTNTNCFSHSIYVYAKAIQSLFVCQPHVQPTFYFFLF